MVRFWWKKEKKTKSAQNRQEAPKFDNGGSGSSGSSGRKERWEAICQDLRFSDFPIFRFQILRFSGFGSGRVGLFVVLLSVFWCSCLVVKLNNKLVKGHLSTQEKYLMGLINDDTGNG